jgi:uncharacterized membrane protein
MYQMIVWIHILAAMTWIGGAVFLVVVLAPVLRNPQYKDLGAVVLRATGSRLRTLGQVSLATLVITGIGLLQVRGIHAADLVNPWFYHSSFGQSVGLKILLVSVIVALSIWHDIWVGPRARDLMTDAPASTEAASARKHAAWLGRITLILGFVVVMLAVFIVRGRPF